jgi:hypothetical protein
MMIMVTAGGAFAKQTVFSMCGGGNCGGGGGRGRAESYSTAEVIVWQISVAGYVTRLRALCTMHYVAVRLYGRAQRA